MSLFKITYFNLIVLILSGSRQVSQNRTDEARDDLQTGHCQHHRPEDRREGRRQEEAREDGHPQVSVAYLSRIDFQSFILPRSKFKAGAENVKSSLKSITAHELLTLLDSKDYVGSVVAKEKYNGKVSQSLKLKRGQHV